ncbi:MAG: TIGR03960 family B12-binding radical SAM protein [Phycisphaerae bacterium]|nr:TIGR03960 family B12-binding radical SAM protein [Phycisphaerae bacterium]
MEHDIDIMLSGVRRPVQYVGLEVNARCAGFTAAEVSVALAFPDTYAIGISHLGSHVLYHTLNDLPGVACDRTYCPAPDAERLMRDEKGRLFGWESRLPLDAFDVLGFSLSYELCVTNVLTMLDLAGLPLRAADRDETHPLIVAGDALADSPEPMAPFIDLFLAGDGEATMPALVELLRRVKQDGAPREKVLLEAARTVPGAYVPRFYVPEPVAETGLSVPRPVRPDVPERIERAHLADLSASPAMEAPLVPLAEGVHERVMIEIMRGCPNGCRFCQAGHVRLPVRWRPVDDIVRIARRAIDATGYDEIALLSLSTSDYPRLDELIDRLRAEFAGEHVSLSLPSLRVDAQLKHLPKLTSDVRKGGLTIAAEAGSQRLRRAIGKRISEADMLAGVRAAYEAGWRKVKVYFIAGLPGETEADIDAIADLCRRLSATGREVIDQPGAINAGVSWFVPKPHTPMQWEPMAGEDYFWSVRRRLKEATRRSPVHVKFHRIERSILEGVIARGDRRVGDAIERAWRRGARLDAWNEHFDDDRWRAAFAAVGIDPDAIARRTLEVGVPLPWSHIRCCRSEQFCADGRGRMLEALGER